MICRLLVRVASLSPSSPPLSLFRSASYDNNACRAQNVEITTLALYLPNKLGPKKKAKDQKTNWKSSRQCATLLLLLLLLLAQVLNKLFCMDRAQQQQQAKSASPVARSGPGSSNNNMWLMWEKTSRMRVEMLHASPSPRRQLKLQLHLHFQLQFCKSYAKTAEGRARSALATWLWFVFFWPHLSCQLCSGHETIHTLQSMKEVSSRWREGGGGTWRGETRAVTRCVLGGCSLDCWSFA